MKRFGEGGKEIHEFTEIDGQPYLRLIRAFSVEEGCLKCHSHQGYKIGDIRGGVTVSLSLEMLSAQERQNRLMLLFLFSCLWVLVSFCILWVSNKLSHAYTLRDETLHRLETLYQKSADGILLLQDGKFISKPVNSHDLYVTLAKWIGVSTVEGNEKAKRVAGRTQSRKLINSPDFQILYQG